MKKKNLIVPALALSVVLGGTIIGTQAAFADEGERTTFAAKIAERFNLNQDEVTSFLDENREERQTEARERFETRLDEAIESGDLTEDQKNLIIAKKADLQSNREENRGERDGEKPTEEEREAQRAEREEHREELESWAEENGIDMEYLMGGKGHGGQGHGNK